MIRVRVSAQGIGVWYVEANLITANAQGPPFLNR